MLAIKTPLEILEICFPSRRLCVENLSNMLALPLKSPLAPTLGYSRGKQDRSSLNLSLDTQKEYWTVVLDFGPVLQTAVVQLTVNNTCPT